MLGPCVSICDCSLVGRPCCHPPASCFDVVCLLDVFPRVGLPLDGICTWPASLTVEGVPKVHGTTCLPSASLA